MTKPLNHLGLSDVELLAKSPSSLSEKQQLRADELREHVRECADCDELVQAQAMLHGVSSGPSQMSAETCPEYEQWLQVAAGVASEQETAKWMKHAAECSACALELRTAIEDVGSNEVDAEVPGLASSGTAWQERMAAGLYAGTAAAGEVKAKKVILFPTRRVWMGTLAAMLLLSVGFAGWRVVRANSDGALMAAAYDAQRRTDLHLAGGDAVPLASLTRGSSTASEPTQLLRLRLRAQEHLEKDPNNAYWHLVLGRVALVENNGQAAREQMATASALDPALPGLQSDLAAAYFEMGEASGDLLSYARAVDLYGHVIDSMGTKADKEALASAYFNRALCWERQSIFYEAVKDYREALALEQGAGWRREIQERLNAVLKASARSEARPLGKGDRSAEAFVRLDGGAVQQADDQYEFYLDAATRVWLAEAGSSVAARDGLTRLAELGTAHSDQWVRDVMRVSPSTVNQEAAMHLGRALEANSVGDADSAFSEAEAARPLFVQAGNRAGALRAEVEAIYTLQRQAKASDCLLRATPLLESKATDEYAWLHGYLLLEAASCSDSVGKAERGLGEVSEALQDARAASLPLQALRAEGFLVAGYDSLGQTQEAWKLAAQGLRECAGRGGTAMATYQFLQSINLALTSKGLRYTAAGMADAAAHASDAVANLQVRAYAQELLARAQTKIGHGRSAEEAFGVAAKDLEGLPAGAATRLYRADWEVDGAELLAQRGQVREAVLRMKGAGEAVSATDNYAVRQEHYTEFARLLLLQRDSAGAVEELSPALRDAEASLSSTQGESQRLAWERSNGRAYRLMVESLAMKGDAGGALRAWEWYRAAAYRASGAQSAGAPAAFDARRLASLTLVVGQTEEGYIVWSISRAGEVRMLPVAVSNESLENLADTFAELCAHRESSVQAIRITGGKLYGMLFGPYQQQIDAADSIQVDVDPRLEHVPFAALQQPDGRYLGLAHGLVFLPAWWSVRTPRPLGLPSVPHALLVEGRQAGDADSSGAVTILPQQYLETRDLEVRFPGAAVLRGASATNEATLRLLPAADIFHYSGHTAMRGPGTALLLGGHDDVLGANEVTPLTLRHLSLATLAACSSTGGTEAMGSSGGLAHAFLTAGASAVVATLWDIDTRSSRQLMGKFYAALGERTSIPEALRTSQVQLAASAETSHPYFWAASEIFGQ